MRFSSTQRGSKKNAAMPLAAHLVELRNRVVKSVIALLAGAVAGWFLYDPVLLLLQQPIINITENSERIAELNYAGVTSPFDLKVKISLFIGVFISSPVWLYQLWAFVVPGLTAREKRYSLSFIGAAVPLFLAGAGVAMFAMPNAVRALTSFTPENAVNIIPAADYLSFVMLITVVFGAAFVLPVLLVGLNFVGVLSAAMIRKSWRWIVVLIFVFAAIATPSPDAISMFFLVIPMALLFFCAWGICALHDRRVRRRMIAEGTWVDPAELDDDD